MSPTKQIYVHHVPFCRSGPINIWKAKGPMFRDWLKARVLILSWHSRKASAIAANF